MRHDAQYKDDYVLPPGLVPNRLVARGKTSRMKITRGSALQLPAWARDIPEGAADATKPKKPRAPRKKKAAAAPAAAAAAAATLAGAAGGAAS